MMIMFDMDHVYILFRGQPNIKNSKFINAYKSTSSRIIKNFLRYANLYEKKHFSRRAFVY